VSNSNLLNHVGQTAGALESSRPIFRFDAENARAVELSPESAFQLQFALRYSF
jgi:hypothetical protein